MMMMRSRTALTTSSPFLRREYSRLLSSSSSSSSSSRPVVLLGNTSLRQVCQEISPEEDASLAADKTALVATLQRFRDENGFGRGIAAPQIGVLKRFIVINMGDGPRVLTNPVISWRSEETFTLFDDCMSLPWVLCKVRRNKSITVEFRNEQGEMEEWAEVAQPLSELLQHEMDHLDGVLIVDRAEGGGRGIVSREEFEKDDARFREEVDYFIEPTIAK
jgi:peptide deformylase